MAGYNEIRGLRVKYLSDDPSNAENGQVWYNSSTSNLRVQGIGSTGWITTATMITNRNSSGFCGTVSAALQFGGTGFTAATEEYNGIGWSAGGDLGSGRYGLGSTGTQTAGLAIGGYSPSVNYSNSTEKYDGSSRTTSGNLGTPNWQHNGVGTQTATIAYGGYSDAAGGFNALSETLMGSTWTSTPSLNTGRMGLAGAGTSTAALGWCGQNPGATQLTEAWDGSSWTTAPNTNEPAGGTNTGAGTQTAALAFGLGSGTVHTELYDGTSWTNATDSPGAIAQGEGGSQTSAVGTQSPFGTQEYAADTATTITAAAWASGGTMNTGRTALGGTGITTAALGMGGGAPLNVQTEEYNGSSWTSTNNINTGRAIYGGAFGPQGAAGAASGEPTSTPAGSSYEEYDGSNWTAGPSLNIARNGGISLGTQTAALCVAGFTGPAAPNQYIKTSESWNGSSWTSLPSPGSDTQTAGSGSSAGTTTAGLIFARYDGSPNYTGKTDEYDGSSWTVGGVMNTARYAAAGSGAQTAAMVSQGYSTGTLNVAEGYDGTVWSTRPNCSVGKYQVAGAGATNTDCISFGGSGNSSATEEFTGETTSDNVNNITVS
mgnify:CR=1 FL=1